VQVAEVLAAAPARVSDFIELTKPRITFLVLVTISVILFNLFADVLYAYLDPRIRLE